MLLSAVQKHAQSFPLINAYITTLLFRRKLHLKRALDEECSLAGARLLLKERAQFLAAESLDLFPRGKRGLLASYITDMPKREEIVSKMVQLAARYHEAVTPENGASQVLLELVDARGTSSYCATCGSKLHSIEGAYDEQWCPSCKKIVNRHGNAAQVIAARGKSRIIKKSSNKPPRVSR